MEEIFDTGLFFDLVDRRCEHNHGVIGLGLVKQCSSILIVITETLLAFLVELFHHQYHLTVYYLVVLHGAISLGGTVFDLAAGTS